MKTDSKSSTTPSVSSSKKQSDTSTSKSSTSTGKSSDKPSKKHKEHTKKKHKPKEKKHKPSRKPAKNKEHAKPPKASYSIPHIHIHSSYAQQSTPPSTETVPVANQAPFVTPMGVCVDVANLNGGSKWTATG